MSIFLRMMEIGPAFEVGSLIDFVFYIKGNGQCQMKSHIIS
jgi:hypothetical protein